VAWLEGRALQRATTGITVSTKMNELVESRWNLPETELYSVPNGYFPETVADVRDREAVRGRVTFLGTLHPKVDANAIVDISEQPEISEMLVIGDGAQRTRFDRLAEEYPDLRVTGQLPDDEAFPLLSSSEVVVNPQAPSELQRSSSPVKLFYYAALGCPMVVSEGPAVVDELVAEDAAISVESDEDFTEQVVKLLTNPELSERLARNAEILADRFTWSKRVSELLSLYAEHTKATDKMSVAGSLQR
jgi:glycosyltransferase involved in cell wall biosynthesis